MSNRIIQPVKFRLKRKQLEMRVDLDTDNWRAFAAFEVNDPKFRNEQYDQQLRNIRSHIKRFEDDLTFFMEALEEDINNI